MQPDESRDLLLTARDHFSKGHYKLAEPILLQLHAEIDQKADVPYMLGTINFERGQLKKAIQLYRQAIDINPELTDASVGLSIILNDLGRYDEAKKVFDEGYAVMKRKQARGKESTLNEKLAQKHAELGELYFTNALFDDAEREYQRAVKLAPDVKNYREKLSEVKLKTTNSAEDLGLELEKSLGDRFFRDLNF
jgi:tetratricopeptide (TPR) repeat protein